MADNCNNFSTITLDDTQLECPNGVHNSGCVTMDQDFPRFGINQGDTLNEALEKLDEYFKQYNRRIRVLEQKVEDLES